MAYTRDEPKDVVVQKTTLGSLTIIPRFHIVYGPGVGNQLGKFFIWDNAPRSYVQQTSYDFRSTEIDTLPIISSVVGLNINFFRIARGAIANNEGWEALDDDMVQHTDGTVLLPFIPGREAVPNLDPNKAKPARNSFFRAFTFVETIAAATRGLGVVHSPPCNTKKVYIKTYY